MKKYAVVTAISSFRMRYVVEIPEETVWDPKVYAEDTVVCEEAQEFSQEWMGEYICDTRIVDHEEVLRLCDEENEYLSSWPDETKMEKLVTRIEE